MMYDLLTYLAIGIGFRVLLEVPTIRRVLRFDWQPNRHSIEDLIVVPGYLIALLGLDVRLLVIGLTIGSGLMFVDFSFWQLVRTIAVVAILWFAILAGAQPVLLGMFILLGYQWCERRFRRGLDTTKVADPGPETVSP